MVAEIREVFAVHSGGSDVSNGKPTWFFEHRVDADQCAHGRGYYAGDAHVATMMAIFVDGRVFLLLSDVPVSLNVGPTDEQARINAARAKLTADERKLLGIR